MTLELSRFSLFPSFLSLFSRFFLTHKRFLSLLSSDSEKEGIVGSNQVVVVSPKKGNSSFCTLHFYVWFGEFRFLKDRGYFFPLSAQCPSSFSSSSSSCRRRLPPKKKGKKTRPIIAPQKDGRSMGRWREEKRKSKVAPSSSSPPIRTAIFRSDEASPLLPLGSEMLLQKMGKKT